MILFVVLSSQNIARISTIHAHHYPQFNASTALLGVAHMKRGLYILMVMLQLTWSGCKEDKDTSPPVLEVLAPGGGEEFQVPISLTVSFNVSDDRGVEFVRIELLDENQQSVENSLTISDPASSFSVAYLIESLDIETGLHYLNVVASDGENDSRFSVAINLFEIPKVLKGVAYVAESGGGYSARWKGVDNSERIYHQANGPIEVLTSGREDAMYVYEQDSRTVFAYELDSEELKWSSSLGLSEPFRVTHALYDPLRKRLAYLTDEPAIREMSRFGMTLGVHPISVNYSPYDFTSDDDHYWLSVGGSLGNRLVEIFKSTGFEVDQISLPFEARHIGFINENLLLAIDELEDVKRINVFTGNITPFPSAGALPTLDLLPLDGFGVFHSETSVYLFANGNSNAPEIYSGAQIGGLSYDEVGGTLIIAEGSSLQYFYPIPWQYLGEQSLAAPASDIRAVFNK
jgi:hypothetical protein